MHNLVSAAAATGVNRSTILRAIKAGRISAQRDETNGWQIDPAELHRVFPPLPSGATTATQLGATTDALVAELRAVIADLYRVPEIVTRGRFPDGGESDSTWRTQEARHVGSDTIAPGF